MAISYKIPCSWIWGALKVLLNIFVVSPIKVILILVLVLPWLCVLLVYEDMAIDAIGLLIDWKL